MKDIFITSLFQENPPSSDSSLFSLYYLKILQVLQAIIDDLSNGLVNEEDFSDNSFPNVNFSNFMEALQEKINSFDARTPLFKNKLKLFPFDAIDYLHLLSEGLKLVT